jgi:hypothetical protein
MPDWKKTVGVLGAEASPEEKAEWHEKLASFVAEPDLAIEEDVVDSGDEECDEHALPQVAATDSSRMVGNAIAARALDHGLQAGMGHALHHFKARVKVQPLEEHEERFYIFASDVLGTSPKPIFPKVLCRCGLAWKIRGLSKLAWKPQICPTSQDCGLFLIRVRRDGTCCFSCIVAPSMCGGGCSKTRSTGRGMM